MTEEEKKWLDDLWSLDEAPESIRASRRFMLEVIKERANSLEYASDELKSDKEIVLAAVQDSGSALEYASEALKNDREIVLEAVKESADSLEYASDELKSDKEIVLEAAKNDIDILSEIPSWLKNDVLDMMDEDKKAIFMIMEMRTTLWKLEEEGIVHKETYNNIEYSFATYLGENLDFDDSVIDDANEAGYDNVGEYIVDDQGNVLYVIEYIEGQDDEKAIEAVEEFRSLMQEYM